jgi:hypothetical protein
VETLFPFGRAVRLCPPRVRVAAGRDLVAVLLTVAKIRAAARFPFRGAIQPARGALPMWLDRGVEVADAVRRTNRGMIAFDLVLGSGALLAPSATLRVLGHRRPSPDAEALFRRGGPIWLTFAAAHAVAAARGREEDWWALAWLRGTEFATDVIWSRSPGFERPGARAGLWLASLGNATMSLGFAWMAGARRR